ncbi:hypothetical protein V8C35DRAFT_302559 [Trichoderma chlorosporum]
MAHEPARNCPTLIEIVTFMQRYPQDDSFETFLHRELAFDFFLESILPHIFSIARKFNASPSGKPLPKELQWIQKVQQIADGDIISRESSSWSGIESTFSAIKDGPITEPTTELIVRESTCAPVAENPSDPTIQEDTPATEEVSSASDDKTLTEPFSTLTKEAFSAVAKETESTIEENTEITGEEQTRESIVQEDDSDTSDVENTTYTGNAEKEPSLQSMPQEYTLDAEEEQSLQSTPQEHTLDTEEEPALQSTPQEHTSDAEEEPLPKNTFQQEFEILSSSFQLWIKDPRSFWEQSTTVLRFTEKGSAERTFYIHAAQEKSEAEIHKFQRRFDSIIAFLRYLRKMPTRRLKLYYVRQFLTTINISTNEDKKYFDLLYGGRRRKEFCYYLSKDDSDISNYNFDDVNFNDIDYGILFLDLSDKMWESGQSRHIQKFKDYLEILQSQNVCALSQKSGARLAAKEILRYRQASIEQNNRKRPGSLEEGKDPSFDSVLVRKRLCADPATFSVLNREADMNSYQAVVATTVRNPSFPETVIASPNCGIHTAQPSDKPLQNSETNHAFLSASHSSSISGWGDNTLVEETQNLASTQNTRTGDIDPLNYLGDMIWANSSYMQQILGDMVWADSSYMQQTQQTQQMQQMQEMQEMQKTNELQNIGTRKILEPVILKTRII